MKELEQNSRNRSEKKFAVVTGASSGIGFHLARVFALNGYDLLIVAEDIRIHDAAQEIADEVAEDYVQVQAHQIDLSDYEGVETLYRRIREDGRAVDAVALNAGVGAGGAFIGGTHLRDEMNMIHLNILSPVHLCKRLAKDMVERGEGRILFTSSLASTMPGPFYAVYAATKAFIQSFSEAIRNELQDTGVTITALMPGATDTGFFSRAGMLDTPAGRAEKDDPALVAQQGFDALMAGDDHVVAGSFKNKIQAVSAKFMSDPMKATVHAKQIRPDSAHH